ncbi:MAG TPA: nucleoside recognition protein [Syntrophomonadaceae bacterium]|nr:nucleoside recognition protein [Syntrophomonadaceae bacterium]
MNVKNTLVAGARKGLDTTWQLAKIIVPVYFAVTILKHTPVMPAFAATFKPVLGLAGLPGEAALSLVLGVFINIYSGIGALLPLIHTVPLDAKQITIISTMLVICHSIPLESAVSQKTGVPFWQVTLLRAVVACITGIILNLVI